MVFDFKEWLLHIDKSAADIHELYYAVHSVEENSTYKCEQLLDGRYLITCSYLTDKLILSTEKQRAFFLDYLQNTYADGDIDGNYGFEQAMSKND